MLLLVSVSALIAVAAGCGLGTGRTPEAGHAPTFSASPPPAGVPLDLDTADKLLHDGEPEQALAIYNAIAQSAQGAKWRRAVSSAAILYYDRGEFEAAAASLTALLDAEPPANETGQALLLLGAAQQQQGLTEAARDSLEKYIEGGGPASAHARVMLATALSADGDEDAAIEELELALAEALPPAEETEALFALAVNQEAAALEADAIASWERLTEEAATPFERGEALWRLVTLAAGAGNDALQEQAVLSLVRDYPSQDRALEALAQAPPSLTSADRGVVLFNHGLNDEATASFQASLEQDTTGAGQARAHLFLALLAERADLPDDALAEYDAALAALAGQEEDRLFGEAAWERALLLEALGRSDEAATAYAGLAAASPASKRAPEALFRAGFLRFRAGLAVDAITHWTAYLQVAGGEETARARFWLAKAALVNGDTASANLQLTAASEGAPWDYFGLRAAALLEGQPPLPLDEPLPDAEPPDWAAVESWLAAWAGPEELEATAALNGGLPLRRGLELLRAGLQDEAEDQFEALRNEAAGEAWLLYRLARALHEEGQVSTTARTAARLVGDRADAPPDILRLAYPSDYLDLATEQAETNGFPPLLLLALVRQESFFEPDAESFASALGLTQVIPSTADEIAGQLDEEEFTYSDLFRPNVSLRFGAHYLGSQLELFEGDIPAALAAYNGGPGNSLRWRESASGDPDVFLETIDLSETRAYVELVLEHYANYRFAYGLTEGPTLPLP